MVVFWLAMVVAGVCAWNAVQIGFYNTWTMFFHLLLAVYMAIFLAPVMVSDVTAAVATSWGFCLYDDVHRHCHIVDRLRNPLYLSLGTVSRRVSQSVRYLRCGSCGLSGRFLSFELHNIGALPQSGVPSRLLQDDRSELGRANDQHGLRVLVVRLDAPAGWIGRAAKQ